MNHQQHSYSHINQRTFRIGIMCRGTVLEAWQARCLENLIALGDVQVSLVIVDEDEKPKTIEKIVAYRQAFPLYRRVFVQPRATCAVDLSALLSGAPTIGCKTTKKGTYSQYFDPSDVATIRAYNLDLILRFAFGIIRGDILDAAHYGVWSFHHDDEEKYRGGPPCFWEIYNGDPVTGAILQRLTDRLDGGIILKKAFLKTIGYSYKKNIDQAYFESAKWPAQVCADIRQNTADYFNNSPSQSKAPIFRCPNHLRVLHFVGKLLKNSILHAYSRLFLTEKWNIGVVREPIQRFLSSQEKPEAQWLPDPGKGKFLADPFGILAGSNAYIFCEEFDYKRQKGQISGAELLGRGSVSSVKFRKTIDLSSHASYPYVLQHKGEFYCIPETFELKEVALFKALSLPYEWIRVGTLLKDVAAVDTTVFQYDGLWWLFCTDRRQNTTVHLFVYYSSDLLGPWLPHAANPVKMDIRSSRPGGTPFIHQGCLYRPSQDCSKVYGGRIIINRVTRLTPREFREEPITVIEPYGDSSYPDGIHTLSAVGDMTLVDGKRYVFAFGRPFSVLAEKSALLRWGREHRPGFTRRSIFANR